MKQLRVGHLTTAYHSNYLLMADEQLEKDLGIPITWRMFDNEPKCVSHLTLANWMLRI